MRAVPQLRSVTDVRRPTRAVVAALLVMAGAPLATVGVDAQADTPATAGTLSPVIAQPDTRPGCATPQYQPDNNYRCPPAAMATAVLSDGRVLFWDGLEGMNKVQFNVVAEFGDVAQNDQSRLLTLNGDNASFMTPSNQAADSDGTIGEPPNSLLPGGVGVANSPGNDYDLFCAPLVQLDNGMVLSAGGTAYYQEPGITGPDGKSYGISELQGLKATRIFDPAKDSWENLPGSSDLHYGRWYPTMVTLPSGQVFIASGVTKLLKPVYTDGRSPADSGRNVVETETFNPSTLKWTLNSSKLPGTDPTLADASQQSLPLFARLHLLPDGKVYYDAGGQTFNPAGEGYDEATWVYAKVYDPETEAWSNLTADTPTGLPLVDGLPIGFRGSGFSVMLPLVPDKDGQYTKAQVFNGGGVVGPTPGSYLGDTSTTINTIDTAHGDALSSAAGPTLLNPRWYGSAVVLPDGEVFITNGADRDEVDVPGSGSPVYQTELVDPLSGKPPVAGPSLDPDHGRTYHNTAVLLPDGRVLIGGHAPIATGYAFQDDAGHQHLGLSSAESDSSFQIYSPPYISHYGPRPVIDAADQRVHAGSVLDIEPAPGDVASITKVVLVRNPSMTHLTDGDQRNIELAFTRDGDELHALVPGGAVVPPGPYMLFIERGATVGDPKRLVPSVSKEVVVEPQGVPSPGLPHTGVVIRNIGPSASTAQGPAAAGATPHRPAGGDGQLATTSVAARRPLPVDARWPWFASALVLLMVTVGACTRVILRRSHGC